eukprot:2422709-Rhodomonas_salina.2
MSGCCGVQEGAKLRRQMREMGVELQRIQVERRKQGAGREGEREGGKEVGRKGGAGQDSDSQVHREMGELQPEGLGLSNGGDQQF